MATESAEPKKPIAAKKAPKGQDDQIMVCLFMAEKGVGGLHQYVGVMNMLIEDTSITLPPENKGDEPTHPVVNVTLKPGSLFFRKSIAERIKETLKKTQSEKGGKELFEIICSMSELPTMPDSLQKQVIQHSWDTVFLNDVYELASEGLATEAKERIDWINSQSSDEVLNRLTPVDLPI